MSTLNQHHNDAAAADDEDDNLPWFDHQPGDGKPPNGVTHLRIGFHQRHQLSITGAAAPEVGSISAPSITAIADCLCYRRPNLLRLQINLAVVSSIGELAFGWCSKLERVEFILPEGSTSVLVSIGSGTFVYCKSLRNVIGLEQAAASLKRIDDFAFSECEALADIDFLAHLPRLQWLGLYAFLQCDQLTTVNLSNAVLLKELKDSTFSHCTALTTVLLPPNLTTLGKTVFSSCQSLASIQLPTSLLKIDLYCLAECTALQQIEFPASLMSIGLRAFGGCESLETVTFGSTHLLGDILRDRDDVVGPNVCFCLCTSLHTFNLPLKVPCLLWPRLIQKFTSDSSNNLGLEGLAIAETNRLSITWNFLRQHVFMYYHDNVVMLRRRARANN